MIYVTGDTHIPTDIHKLSSKRFAPPKDKPAYLIICGDFGGVWDGSNEEKYWLKWLDNKSFITLFVDGNHENFDLLYQYPCVEFCGGRAHKIGEKVYHLMRGQIYGIENKSFFILGGASSHDKAFRSEGLNWWRQELPSAKELEAATKSLEAAEWSVNYVITHCAPSSLQKIFGSNYQADILTDYLEEIKAKLSYKKWFFGHYHTDLEIDDKHCAMFERVIRLEP